MIDFEQELNNHFGQVKDFTLGMRIAKYFYELGSSEKPNNHLEGLDEAAELWIAGVFLAYSVPNTSVKELREIAEKSFKAGAEYARKLTGKDIAIIEQLVGEYGIEIADAGFPIPWNSPEFYDEVARRFNESKR